MSIIDILRILVIILMCLVCAWAFKSAMSNDDDSEVEN